MTKKLTAILLFGLLVLSACSTAGGGASSPSATVQGFADAVKAKDYDKFVDYLSNGTVEMFSGIFGMMIEAAKEDPEQKEEIETTFEMSIEDFEKLDSRAQLALVFKNVPEASEGMNDIGDFEILNEVIDGDNATVTIKTDDGEEDIPLVKEDGSWKVDLAGMF